MRTVAFSDLLSSYGFEGDAAALAFDRLCERGLTRRGKKGIAASKMDAVDRAFAEDFARHCRKSTCQPLAADRRVPVLVSPAHCQSCGGSENRRAVEEMVTAMRGAGLVNLLVAGGSPGTRGDLERLCGGRIDLRFITEETPPGRKNVRPMLAWSHIAAIWTSSEISHMATECLRGGKVVKVPRRGVAALATIVRDRCWDAGPEARAARNRTPR